MTINLSQSFGQRLEVRQEQRLTLAQRILVQTYQVRTRLELIQELRGIQYEPTAICPRCNRKLTTVEILAGFTDDPDDRTTQCTGCFLRFEPLLVHRAESGVVELPFYCASQVLPRLERFAQLSPQEISSQHQAEYHSAILHYGTLTHAFAAAGLTYHHDEPVEDWRDRVQSFLGKLPDTVIAEVLGVSARAVGSQRRKARIPAYSVRQVAEDLDCVETTQDLAELAEDIT